MKSTSHLLDRSFIFLSFLFIIVLAPNDIARLNERATTAIYNEPKNGILNRDDISTPKWFVYSSIKIPKIIPTSNPTMRASFLNDLIYRPKNNAGKICVISIPRKSCSDIAQVAGIVNTKSSATNLKTVDEIFVILISELADVFGLISFIIFRVSRFPCDIAIIAADTRPPMNMPRRAIPVNQEGVVYKINEGQWKPMPSAIYLYVNNTDATYKRADGTC